MTPPLLPVVLLSLILVQGAPPVVLKEEGPSNIYGATYQFKYHVHDLMTMDYKTHEETGENGSVRGSYTVREPNGDLRVVSYTAGDTRGFQAMVRVKPTLTSSAKRGSLEIHTTEKPAPKSERPQETNSPLRIQLDTGRRADHELQTQQKHSKMDKPSATSKPPTVNAQENKQKVKSNSAEKSPRMVPKENKQLLRRARFQGEGYRNPFLQPNKRKEADAVYSDRVSPTSNIPQLKQEMNEPKPQRSKIEIGTDRVFATEKSQVKNQGRSFSRDSLDKVLTHFHKHKLGAAYLPYHVHTVKNSSHHGHIFAPLLLHILPDSPTSENEGDSKPIYLEENSSKLKTNVVESDHKFILNQCRTDHE